MPLLYPYNSAFALRLQERYQIEIKEADQTPVYGADHSNGQSKILQTFICHKSPSFRYTGDSFSRKQGKYTYVKKEKNGNFFQS